MPGIRIDLISDTATKPTPAMRQAMAEADVGDEQRGEDLTVNALCHRVAMMLGKERAIFLPSGTMCNQIAQLVHCRPGDEIIAADSAHIVGSEGAGAAVLAGSVIRPVASADGTYSGDDVEAAIRNATPKAPRSRLVVVEQTSNRGGGTVWQLTGIADVAARARQYGLSLHMDGARLMNAVIASGISAEDYAAPFDSVWLDLSKGLGCPVGAVLAGSRDFIDAAWIWKHRLGGAMRQAGILAAAGLNALDAHVTRLADDHANAKLLADGIGQIERIKIDQRRVDTNIVFLNVRESGLSASQVAEGLARAGIRVGVEGPYRLRAVTHLGISAADIAETIDTLERTLQDTKTDQ